MQFKIELGTEDYNALVRLGIEQRRPPNMMAEWLVMEGIREYEELRKLDEARDLRNRGGGDPEPGDGRA